MKSVLRYPGSKSGMAKAILDHFPQHNTYIEPFFGGGSVFFSKEPSKYEVINDLSSTVVNFWRVCRDHADDLAKAVSLTPWSREEYEDSYGPPTGDSVEDARRFLVRTSQAYGIRLTVHTGWKNRGSSGATSVTSGWDDMPERIRLVADRLKLAEIDNRPATEVIKRLGDQSDALFYIDPPYVLSTRNGNRYYHHEMDEQDHYRLLDAALGIRGAVIISGYGHPIYRIMLKGWYLVEIKDVAEQGQERIECLWMNSRAYYARQMRMEF